MDDEDTKIRRNLVVFSAAVLLLAWLEIPFSSLLGGLGDSRRSLPDNWRLWSAGSAVLAYLGIRYSFSDEGARYADALQKEYRVLLQRAILRIVEYQAIRHLRGGAAPNVYSGEFFESTQNGNVRKNWARWGGVSSIHVAMYGLIDEPWVFDASFNVIYPREAGAGVGPAQYISRVNIPKRYRLALSVWSRCSWLFYSKESIRHFFPAFLGLAASSVLTLRAIGVCA